MSKQFLILLIFFNNIFSTDQKIKRIIDNNKITFINYCYTYNKLVLRGISWETEEFHDKICKIEKEEKDKKVIYIKYLSERNSENWVKSEMAVSNEYGYGVHYYMRDGDWCQSFDYIKKYWKLFDEYEDLKAKSIFKSRL